MLPNWMKQADAYVPPADGGTFALKTIKTLGHVMARIGIQKGHEKGRHLPALFKLLAVLALIVAVSVSQNPLIITGIAAALLVYLCTWPARDIWRILKAGLTVGAFALLLFLPAMIAKPSGIGNAILVVAKVFLSVAFISIYNHTTQWNHITGALRALRIPHLFIFTLDMTLKYIVLLGNLITDLLTALQLRSVGKNNQKYHAVGGVMGVTFIRGAEMNRQMYEAMCCRGFTDDYEGL